MTRQLRLPLFAVTLLLAASISFADGVPGTVSTDAFDSTSGTIVVAHDTIVDPINCFTTSGGFEGGHTLMRNGGLNSVSFINFQTGGAVSISGVRLFAHNDGAGNFFRRAMNRFRLLADTDGNGSYETVMIDEPINVDYGTEPGNAAASPSNLDLTLIGATTTAQQWRLEVTQGTDVQPFEGARVVEVDAIVLTDVSASLAAPATATPGTSFSVTTTVSNGGSLPAYNTTLNIPPPAGMTFVSNAGNCVTAFPCSFGTVGVGGTRTVTTTWTIPSGYLLPNPFTVTATALVGPSDTNGANNVSSASIALAPLANLAVSKSGPATAVPGTTIAFTTTVSNAGPSSAQGVSLADPTPAGLVFVSNSGDCVTAFPCSLGTIPSGGMQSVTTTYSIPSSYVAPDPISNTATVSSATPDPSAANDTSTANAAVTLVSDLTLSKTGPVSISPGQNVTYTIVVSNNGPSDATFVTLSDTPPAGLAFVSNSGACTTAFPCDLGTIPSGGVVGVTSVFLVPANYTGADPIVNSATVTSAASDPTPGNATSSAGTAVRSRSDLIASITGPGTAAGGDVVDYVIRVRNRGPADAFGVVITFPLPRGTSFVSAGSPCSGGFPCNIAVIRDAVTVEFGVRLRITGDTAQPMLARVSIDHRDVDLDPANDVDVVSTLTCPSPVTLTFPATGAVDVSQSGTLNWTAINADSYDVYLGPKGGGCSTRLATVSESSFRYTNLVRRSPYEWRIVASKAGCPSAPVSSSCSQFNSGPPCPIRGPDLLFPPDGGQNFLSPIAFAWEPLEGAMGYRVFASVDGSASTSLGETTSTTLVANVVPGNVSWHVEVLFADCSSVKTETRRFVARGECITSPARLVSPLNGVTGSSPARFNWEPVGGAIGYALWVSVNGENPIIVSTTTNLTEATAQLPSGEVRWFIESRYQNCPPSISQIRTITIPPKGDCSTVAVPLPLSPQAGSQLFAPVSFSWTGSSSAIGYAVWASIDGDTSSIVASTKGATTASVSLRPGAVRWFVQAFYEQCATVRSETRSFTILEPGACDNAAPTLVTPVRGATVGTSTVRFEWNGVEGASEYRVWIRAGGSAKRLLGSVPPTRSTLTAPVPRGTISWFVEALFTACESKSSGTSSFEAPAAPNCRDDKVDLIAPRAGEVITGSTRVELRWSGIVGATSYRLWTAIDNGSPTLLATTTATSFTAELPFAAITWYVDTLFDGCPAARSLKSRFTVSPGDCSTVSPVNLAPQEGAAELSSPVVFVWTPIKDSKSYRLVVEFPNAAPFVVPAAAASSTIVVPLPPGAARWYIEADVDGCPTLRSAPSDFRVIADPPCEVPAAPGAGVVGEVTSGSRYRLFWERVAGSTIYEVQQTTRIDAITGQPDFSETAVIPTTEYLDFTAPPVPDGLTALTIYFRVRGIADCDQQRGRYSAPVSVVVTGADTSAQLGTLVPITRGLTLCADDAGTVFVCDAQPAPARRSSQAVTVTLEPTEPWLTIDPASGTIPAGGSLTVRLSSAPANLPAGTSTAGLRIVGTTEGGLSSSEGSTTGVLPVSVGLASPVTPKPRTEPPPYALVIPAVIHSDSVNGMWQSDVRVANTTAKRQKYQLNFTPSGIDGTQQGKQALLEIGAGQVAAIDDIARSWYGAAQTSITGVLEIRALDPPAESSDSGDSGSTLASSRTYNATPFGNFGQFVPAIPFGRFIGASSSGANQLLSLQQLAENSGFRTNLGITEGSGQAATVLVTFFDRNGVKLGAMTVPLKPAEHLQINSILASLGITADDVRAEVSVTSLAGRVTAYASVIDRQTTDPILVAPVNPAELGATRFVLPGIADLSSAANQWRSDVRIFNGGDAATLATLTFYPQNDPTTPATKEIALDPGAVLVMDDVLRSQFGLSNTGGVLHVSTAAPSRLVATARTYDRQPGGTYGQFIPAVTPAQAIGGDDRPLQILQLEQSDRLRTNVGIAEVTGEAVTVELLAVVPGALAAPKMTLTLQPNEFRQLNGIFRLFGMEQAFNGRIFVDVISGSGRVTAYGSVIDNRTSDPAFVPAQ